MSKKSEFVQKIYQAGLAAGLTDAAARVMASQAAIESAYGDNAPGNNFFGITKGKDWTGPTIVRTDRDANGNKVRREFRSYDTPQAGIADRVAVMADKFPDFNKAATVGQALDALQKGKLGKYYEAPQAKYESAVNGINTKYLGGTPVPPENIPNSSASSSEYLAGKQYGKPGGGVGVNADKLNPEFSNRLSALIGAAEQATGDKVQIFEGYRDPARSAQLHADFTGQAVTYGGKTYQPTPGMKGKFRASAPGVSEHNIGMAADIRAGKEPDKYPSGPAYDYMTKHAAEYGLHWYGSADPAHFEIPPDEFKVASNGGQLSAFATPTPPPINSAVQAIDAATGTQTTLKGQRLSDLYSFRSNTQPTALGSFGGRLPSAAMNGVDRTNTPLSQIPPDQVPQSFLGAPFPTDQTMPMLGPSRNMSQPNMMGRNSPPSMQALGTPVGMDRPTVIAPNVSRETTVTKTVLNPAYTKWEAQYGHGGANVSGSPDDRSIKNASGSPDERGILPNTPPAPPKTIKVQVPASQNIFQQFGGAIQQGITNDVQGLQNTGNSLGTFATQTVPVAAQQAKDAVIRGIMMSPAERGAIIEPFLSRGFTDKAFTTVNETPTKYGTTFLDRQAQAQQRAALSNFGQQVPMTSTGVGTRLSVTPSSSRNRNSGSGGIQQPSGGGQTFKGSKTGREYTVGRTYSNQNGQFQAMANGTFQKIG